MEVENTIHPEERGTPQPVSANVNPSESKIELAVENRLQELETKLQVERGKTTNQLNAMAKITHLVTESIEFNEFLQRVLAVIHESFNIYHVAVYFKEAGSDFAVLREAAGEAGSLLNGAGYKIKIDNKSIVGQVIGTGSRLILNEQKSDTPYLVNPLLPETRSEAAFPLVVNRQVHGALDIHGDHENTFDSDSISSFIALADLISLVIQKNELFVQTQESLSQQRLLHHVINIAVSGSSLETALSSAAQGLQVTLGGDHISILLLDQNHKKLTIGAFSGYPDDFQNMVITPGEGVTGWVVVNNKSLLVNDVALEPRYIPAASSVHSELAVPLTYRGDILGVLNVESDQVGAYSEKAEELLATVGGVLAALIANSRLIEQTRALVDRERLLFELTSKIRRSTDIPGILSTMASELTKAFNANRAEINISVEETSTQ